MFRKRPQRSSHCIPRPPLVKPLAYIIRIPMIQARRLRPGVISQLALRVGCWLDPKQNQDSWLPVQCLSCALGHQSQPPDPSREWQSPAALYFYCIASPGFLRNTYPKYVRILYLVSSSQSTLTPLSVTWFTLSLKQNSRESYTSEQLLTGREHSLHQVAEASRSWPFPAVNAP